jgi:predicted PurR-regulated permease PerM
MSLTYREQAKYWGIFLVVFIAILWAMGSTLLPFIVGAAIAYFLDPVADRLEARGFSRVVSTSIITLFAVLFFLIAIIILLPLLIEQAQELAAQTPNYIASFMNFMSEKFPSLMDSNSAIRRGLTAIEDMLKEGGTKIVEGILATSLALFDFVLLLVVAPVVAFYLLLDWDRLVAKIDSWIPREHVENVRQIARDIDKVLSGFVRGQMTVCGILAIYYSVSLVLIGLQFGVVVGFIAGLISFIPFVGAIIGGVLSIGLAIFQFWDQPIMIGAVAAVFIIGQMIEGNVLTPKLVGSSVGLHPVWLMFALSAFGSFFGFAGLLIAVPVAASIGVLGRFAIGQYMSGRLYNGPEDPDAEPGEPTEGGDPAESAAE